MSLRQPWAAVPHPVPQLLAFLPWLLVPTAAGLLFALFARWWIGAVWGVALLGLLAWFVEPYGKTGDPAGPPVAELRVLTSNVEVRAGHRRADRRRTP